MQLQANPRRSAFSLIELLVVTTLLIIVAGLSVPAANNMKRSMDLQSGSARLMEQLQIARQTARTKNRQVEVRLYLPAAGAGLLTPPSVQLYLVSEDGLKTPLDKAQKLPDSIAISTSDVYSTLLASCTEPATEENDDRSYRAFRFAPNGTVRLTTTPPVPPTLTVLSKNDFRRDPNALPSNFITLQIDLQTGRVRAFHP